jgi:sugar-specific transcriptional regulator TrmB
MTTVNKLVQYGLTKQEAAVYLDVLSHIDTSAFATYKRVGLPKTSVYHVLESLKKRGLVESWKKNNIAYYSASNPKRLITEIKEKEELLATLVPELLSFTNMQDQGNFVKMYEGGEGLKNVMREALEYCDKNKINNMLTAATDSLNVTMPKFMKKWLEDREKMSIFVKMLIPNTKTIPNTFETNKLRETRFLPEGFELPSTINIYGNRVDLFYIKGDKINSVVIDSKAYTDLLRNFFLLIWQSAPKDN